MSGQNDSASRSIFKYSTKEAAVLHPVLPRTNRTVSGCSGNNDFASFRLTTCVLLKINCGRQGWMSDRLQMLATWVTAPLVRFLFGCKGFPGTMLPFRPGRARDMLVSSTLIKTACLPAGTLLRSHETHCKNFTTLGSQNGNLREDRFVTFLYLHYQ